MVGRLERHSKLAQNQYRLQASQDGWNLDLILEDTKGPILQGDLGYSRKGPQPGNASIYISQTRLNTHGTVETEGKTYEENGTSWMDHEFSTSALSDDQVGWDWFALQLEDESELMMFTIRKADGSIDPFSSGTVIYQDGSTRTLSSNDFQIEVLDTGKVQKQEQITRQDEIQVPSEDLNLKFSLHRRPGVESRI
jgi:predicted secreted hydrolase